MRLQCQPGPAVSSLISSANLRASGIWWKSCTALPAIRGATSWIRYVGFHIRSAAADRALALPDDGPGPQPPARHGGADRGRHADADAVLPRRPVLRRAAG